MVRFSPLLLLLACGGDKTADSGTSQTTTTTDTTDDATGTCPQPADGYTNDALTSGGAKVICYYAPPEGYCREIRSTASNDLAVTDGKGAIGCADAVAVTDGACPTDLAIGRCENWGTDEDRVYYACNKFDSVLPQGVDVACEEFGGTWVPL